MKKTGISLIVLIVTIIVIIILAAVVILTLSKNNPIESSKEAAFKEDVRTFQDELAMYISKDYTAKAGARDEKITATNYEPEGDPKSVYTYISSFSKKYEGKFVIKNDELMYSEGKLTDDEQKWSNSLNVKLNQKTGAEKAKEDPENYYGAIVEYKTGNEDIDNDITEWKIFYSDDCNVYIISSNYVDPSNLPEKDGAKPDCGDPTNYPKAARFNNILSKYRGSSDIIDEKMKVFNSDYFEKNYSSENYNMKAVAYMLDKDIWSTLYANSCLAEYAVGGPSVEMLLKSYCEKNPDKKEIYKTQAGSAIGYQISKDGGKQWAKYYLMFSKSDDLYVLPASYGASNLWLASPSYNRHDRLTIVSSGGIVGANDYDYRNFGFRPLVCLNSNINLTWNEQDQIYEIN